MAVRVVHRSADGDWWFSTGIPIGSNAQAVGGLLHVSNGKRVIVTFHGADWIIYRLGDKILAVDSENDGELEKIPLP